MAMVWNAVVGATETLVTVWVNSNIVSITNTSATDTLYFWFGLVAWDIAVNKGIVLAPWATYNLQQPNAYVGDFYAIASANTITVSYYYA